MKGTMMAMVPFTFPPYGITSSRWHSGIPFHR
jgi:hypothetical protein